MSGHEHHGSAGGLATATPGRPVVALVGAPNAGKTSLFNLLTGIRAKTGNYPGVTVARSYGRMLNGNLTIEDLPGTYSLRPLSPDEQVVIDSLEGKFDDVPDAIVLVVDSTTLRRSLNLVAHTLQLKKPTALVLTMTDELAARGGSINTDGLSRALGIPVFPVLANRGQGVGQLREQLPHWQHWSHPAISPPTQNAALQTWMQSMVEAANYSPATADVRTRKIDRLLLHPVTGLLTFFVVMFAFFQIIFTVAAPVQGWIEDGFSALSALIHQIGGDGWIASLLGDAIVGGVGGVLVFLPQIILMFLMIALLEGFGYMARAAFLMDRVMSWGGLEGRAFVAMLSAFACAIPGIMATRTMPNAKDRLATIMSAPLITCSARLPVYALLVGMLVSSNRWVGPFNVQGLVMFAMYVLGGTTAMLAASIAKRVQGRKYAMPFSMELPPYRVPTARSVLTAMWVSSSAFLRKAGTIILGTTIVLWMLLNLPVQSTSALEHAGVDTANPSAVATYTMDNSIAAGIGKAIEPVFAPLGFDWRVNVGIVASLSARETFVATMSQIAAASNPDDPQAELKQMTYQSGPNEGLPVFSPSTIVALLLFFAFALQCMSTVGIMRRETGSWKWPGIAFGYMFVLAWSAAFIGHGIAELVWRGVS